MNGAKNVTGPKSYLIEHAELTETVHGAVGLSALSTFLNLHNPPQYINSSVRLLKTDQIYRKFCSCNFEYKKVQPRCIVICKRGFRGRGDFWGADEILIGLPDGMFANSVVRVLFGVML